MKTTVDAIPALTTDQTIKLFEKFGVFSKAELESRTEVAYEAYAKEINIEARAMIDIAGKQIVPSVVKAVNKLADSLNSVKAAVPTANVIGELNFEAIILV